MRQWPGGRAKVKALGKALGPAPTPLGGASLRLLHLGQDILGCAFPLLHGLAYSGGKVSDGMYSYRGLRCQSFLPFRTLYLETFRTPNSVV